MKPRDLVATEDVDRAIDHEQAEWLMESCCDSSPAEVGQAVVDSIDPPDIALHRAQGNATVRQEIVIAAIKAGIPGVVVRECEPIDREGGGVAPHPRRLNDFRPLRRPAREEMTAGMLFHRSPLADKSSILEPGHIEVVDAVDDRKKAHLAAVTTEALVDAFPSLRW